MICGENSYLHIICVYCDDGSDISDMNCHGMYVVDGNGVDSAIDIDG